ncbi:MAG: aromatic amino acid ammonia-lyase [Spirochaeta sp.]|nr:aromatic amino acid ammonia-lyase [Spirochaeta sp.]
MKELILDGNNLICSDLTACREPIHVSISDDARARCRASRNLLERMMRERRVIYGVTTGFGDSVDTAVDPEAAEQLQHNLVQYHRIGTGPRFSREETRAILLVRLNALVRGASAVRDELLDQLILFLNEDCLPLIPEQGSVGASGDLTPLAYVAAALCGEGEVVLRDRTMAAAEALTELEVAPLTLAAKEGLALMNGTSVMTALAAHSVDLLKRCTTVVQALAAAAAEVTGSDRNAYAPAVHAMKPHPGQVRVAQYLYDFLPTPAAGAARRVLPEAGRFGEKPVPLSYRLQAPYSIRCAPHVIGPALEVLDMVASWLHVELNSSNDNPLFDPDQEEVYFSGHFFGGHVVVGAATLRNAVATLGELVDKQCLLLLDARRSGLPANLVSEALRATGNHGLKALGITVSALAAEIAHLSAPVAPHSRPTESMNQDIVSMGTISARRLREVTDLFVRQAAMQCIVIAAACDLYGLDRLGPALSRLYVSIRRYSPPLSADRPLDAEAEALAAAIRTGGLLS